MVERHLHAVDAGEKPKAPPRKRAARTLRTVTGAAKSGDYRATLVAIRDRLAVTVENPNTPPRDLASNSRRLLEVMKEIEALDAKEAEEDAGGVSTEDSEWDGAAI